MVMKTPDGMQLDTASLETSPEIMLERIDSVLVELRSLRWQVQQLMQPKQSNGITEQLYGALGQASPEEFNYDTDINLYRFSDE